MTTGKCGHCRWWGLLSSLGVAFGAWPAAFAATATNHTESAREEGAAQPTATPALNTDLYLEVLLNRVKSPRLLHVVVRDGRFLADAEALRGLGLTWPGASSAAGLVLLDALPGLHSEYDEADQRLLLTAPIELLGRAPEVLGYRPPAPPRPDPASMAPGLLLNYDLYAQGDDANRSLNGWNELRLFGITGGLLRSSSLLQMTEGRFRESTSKSTRLDTSWQFDFPDSMVSLTLGDAYSGAVSWSRTMRFGGLRLSRNFALQPYRVVVPLASFAGEAALPSAVDLYINGVREMRSNVAPGRFEMVGAPVLNGMGNAQMVITDITGQSRVVNFPLYNSARLLQQGLTDWSVEVGNLRRDYGLRSYAYADQTMVSGSVQHGLSNSLTLESHGEVTDGLRMAGGGAQWLLGRAGGVLSTSYAGSQQGTLNGHQRTVGYEWQGQRFNMNMSSLRRSRGFRDLASLEGAALALRTDHAFMGVNMGRSQFGMSYVRQDMPDSPRTSLLGLSWTQSYRGRGNLSVGVNRDLERNHGTNAYVYWAMPLGDRLHGWASAEHNSAGEHATLGAMRSLPGDSDGWGWRVETSMGAQSGAQAEITQLTRFGQWRAGTQYWRHGGDGHQVAYAGASGALLLMQGSVFPMRRAFDAFALVSTDGIGGVPVMLENRPVGSTDDDGLLLVTPLNAWQNNDLSIDPLELPLDVSFDRIRMAAVPATGGGMVARFPMRAMLAVDLTLRLPDGRWVPAGTSVDIEPGAQRAVVGYDGRVYLQSPRSGARVLVAWGDGQCMVRLPDNLPVRGRIDLGAFTCQ